ncbi:MAG: HD domain-containing phosphohydrolase [Thermodesulfobacteriota bacterium]
MPLKYKHTILLLDDEKSITNALQRLLHRENYGILTAASGEEALDLMKRLERPVSLIISDQRMPGMNGSRFLEESRKMCPNAVRFLLTGYSDMDTIVEAVNKGEIHRYLTKPWNDGDLLVQIRQSLEHYELQLEHRRLLGVLNRQNKELKELNTDLEKKVEARAAEVLAKNRELDRLNKELEGNLFNTVRAFASLSEMHAPFLAGHGRRVGEMSREVALLMGLSEKEAVYTEIAGLLHDIGMLGFPQRIIEFKEETWTAEDMDLFRKHPEEGQTIVRFINSLDHVGLLIRSHHERVDGKGFPDGLREEAIPLESRIIAVADAYDRIAHLRAGRRSWLSEYLNDQMTTRDHLPDDERLQQTAIHHLKRHAFTDYDPDVVKVFLGMLNTKGIALRNEKELAIGELKPGMVLSRSLYTGKGRFLLPHNSVLSEDLVFKLRAIHRGDPIEGPVYVVE